MSHRVYIRPEAEQDLEDAAAWYTQQRPGLGQALLDELLNPLSKSPRSQDFIQLCTGTRAVHLSVAFLSAYSTVSKSILLS